MSVAWSYDRTRLAIAALIFLMADAVLFDAGVVAMLTAPGLSDHAGGLVPAVVILAGVLALPVSWAIAGRIRGVEAAALERKRRIAAAPIHARVS